MCVKTKTMFIWEGQWFCTCLGSPTNKTTVFLSEESKFPKRISLFYFIFNYIIYYFILYLIIFQDACATFEEWDLCQNWWRNVEKSLQVLSGFTRYAPFPCELLIIDQWLKNILYRLSLFHVGNAANARTTTAASHNVTQNRHMWVS